jgi:fructokinase
MTKYGGIQSGGSKWECAIAMGPEELCAVTTIPTTTPNETIGRAVDFFSRAGPVDAIGIGSFGPVDTRIDSMTWGYITTTPKPGWANTDVGQEIRRRLDVPVAFDTDVNAAALGEHRWGAGRELRTLWYVTVGSGIGGGAIVDGRVPDGLFHPSSGICVSRTISMPTRSTASVRITATASRGSLPARRSRRAGEYPRRRSRTATPGCWRRATSRWVSWR